jgi:ankyrin repeat protein
MKHLQSYNESLRDKMRAKSKDEIIKGIDNIDAAMIQQIDNSNANEDENKETINNIRLLLEHGADPSYANYAVLRYACWVGDLDFFKELIEKYNTPINAYEDTALEYAAQYHHPDILQYIIDNGGNVDEHGEKAMKSAIDQALNVEKGILSEVVLILVENGLSKDRVKVWLHNYCGDKQVDMLMEELDKKLNDRNGSK